MPGLGEPSPASPRSNVSSEFAAQYRPTGGCTSCGGGASPGRAPHPQIASELHDAHDEIHDLFRRVAQHTDQQFAQIDRRAPEHHDFKATMQRLGEDWERQISEQAIHKLAGAIGGGADEERDRKLRENIHLLFWIMWTRNALFYLKCQLKMPLNGAGLHGGAFDTSDPSMLRHMDRHQGAHLEQHPESDGGHDLVLLAQDVMPDEVNAALTVAWSILNASGDADHHEEHNIATLYGAGSMTVIQALLGFLTQALVCHRTASEQLGARAEPLDRDLDRSFANFLGMCGRRALEICTGACVAAMSGGEAGDTPHGGY